jgi:FixJ family two-component response regulator
MSDKAPLIHVVDDDDAFREAALALLDAAGFEAIGHASAGDFLLHPLPDRPGCVLLDLHMPGPSGLDLQTALGRAGTELAVIFLTGRGDVTGGVAAMKAGAVDFLEKPLARDALFEAIRRALDRSKTQRADRVAAANPQVRFDSLSPRERTVFDQVIAGRTNKQIAAQLNLVDRIVKLIRAQMMVKLEVESTSALCPGRAIQASRLGRPRSLPEKPL